MHRDQLTINRCYVLTKALTLRITFGSQSTTIEAAQGTGVRMVGWHSAPGCVTIALPNGSRAGINAAWLAEA